LGRPGFFVAKSIQSNKAGNARRKLLAYRSYSCIQTTQNGEVDFAQFPMVQKSGKCSHLLVPEQRNRRGLF
jgi:hypothetical protein